MSEHTYYWSPRYDAIPELALDSTHRRRGGSARVRRSTPRWTQPTMLGAIEQAPVLEATIPADTVISTSRKDQLWVWLAAPIVLIGLTIAAVLAAAVWFAALFIAKGEEAESAG